MTYRSVYLLYKPVYFPLYIYLAYHRFHMSVGQGPPSGGPSAGQVFADGAGARERILETAYDLFTRYGIRAVGIDRIVAEAGVAKMSLYRHFPSKEGLALAVLDLRRERWTRDWLRAAVERLGSSPRGRLLAYFDAFDEWFNGDYEGCAFINTLLETPGADPTHVASIRELELIRLIIEDDAREAGILEPEELSYQLQILLMGAIVSARRGDLGAARRARQVAEVLIDGMPRAEIAATG